MQPSSRLNHEQGIVIMLVAVVMLFVVGAMAALSIDVVTLYTARSEAQLAADGAALAGARVLANSGMTSDTTGGLTPGAETLATTVALQVGQQNQVGGRYLIAANGEVVVVGFSGTATNPCTAPTNPCITVQVQRTDLPTFFARIWGSKQVTVGASATAEAYNPSGADALGVKIPVAPICVKPWLLPNIDPTSPPNPIFVTATGAIAPTATALLGYTTPAPPPPGPIRLKLVCNPPNTVNPGDCSTLPAPQVWQYYPGNPASFPPPTQPLPACSLMPTPTPYQESVAGCIQTPIACNSPVSIDSAYDATRNSETADAATCLTHAMSNLGDKVDFPDPPSAPFQFIAGADNPVAVVTPALAGSNVMISDSLVTVPVFDVGPPPPPFPAPPAPPGTVQIVGFVQLFLSPQGTATPFNGHMRTTVVNMAGCGPGWSGTPILGNGASPVAVRLISPP